LTELFQLAYAADLLTFAERHGCFYGPTTPFFHICPLHESVNPPGALKC
jgi:hypothetical protein